MDAATRKGMLSVKAALELFGDMLDRPPEMLGERLARVCSDAGDGLGASLFREAAESDIPIVSTVHRARGGKETNPVTANMFRGYDSEEAGARMAVLSGHAPVSSRKLAEALAGDDRTAAYWLEDVANSDWPHKTPYKNTVLEVRAGNEYGVDPLPAPNGDWVPHNSISSGFARYLGVAEDLQKAAEIALERKGSGVVFEYRLGISMVLDGEDGTPPHVVPVTLMGNAHSDHYLSTTSPRERTAVYAVAHQMAIAAAREAGNDRDAVVAVVARAGRRALQDAVPVPHPTRVKQFLLTASEPPDPVLTKALDALAKESRCDHLDVSEAIADCERRDREMADRIALSQSNLDR